MWLPWRLFTDGRHIAGNTGNQTLTLLVRSIAMGQVTASNTMDLFKKELGVALINGLLWGAIAGLGAWLLYFDASFGMKLGLVMFLAMMLNIIVGALVGLIVPLTLKKFDRDPAMGSSVLLTFITDSGGFLICLGLAGIFFLRTSPHWFCATASAATPAVSVLKTLGPSSALS